MLAYFMANLCVAYINWPFDCTRTESDSKVKYYKINEGDKKLPHTRAEVPILRGKYITKISLVLRRAHIYPSCELVQVSGIIHRDSEDQGCI